MYNTEYEQMQKTETNVEQKKSGAGVAGMVLGIITLVTSFIPFLSLVLAILGIIFSGFGLKNPSKGMAIAGMIMSVLGFFWGIIYAILFVTVFQEVWREIMENGGLEGLHNLVKLYFVK